jgi:two-component system alkaline phosphatase synthesis response regulator PhoP
MGGGEGGGFGGWGEAEERVREERPDLVVLDVLLPTLDGFEVLRGLKSDAELAGIPVVMLTARNREADLKLAAELGAVDYVTKPFSPADLMARVRRICPVER